MGAFVRDAATGLGNDLLDRLSASSRAALTKSLLITNLPAGTILYDELVEQTFVYFPISGVVSFLLVMKNGGSAEVGMVGREGLVGLAAVLGGRAASERAVVQVAGAGWRMTAETLRECVIADRPLAAMLAQYAQAFFAQVAHTAVCNRLHTTAQQFSRWILMTLDRIDGDHFDMTQQAISNMLGARREQVNLIALHLRDVGAIQYNRGSIQVLDRSVLESEVCECYRVLNERTEKLLDFSAEGSHFSARESARR